MIYFLLAAEHSLTSSTVEHREKHDALLLQDNPGPSTPENLNLASRRPSQTSENLENNNGNYCLSGTDFRMSDIKDEQEEIAFPSPEIVTSEQDQPEAQVSYEMQPLSSDCESDDSNDEQASNKAQQTKTKQGGSEGSKGQAVQPPKNCCSKSQKDRSFCHLCGKGFQYIGSLMKHIKTHESTTDCTICATRHQSAKHLITHLQRCHSKSIFCNVCGKTFVSKRYLRVHERIHTGTKEFVCQECGRTFNRKEHLVVHVRIHSGEKPYHCEICGKAFSQSQNLTIHKRSHSGERPYHCGVCGKLFNTSSALKSHTRYHSGEKPYPCEICGKRFHMSGHMRRHKTTHTGERPFACQI